VWQVRGQLLEEAEVKGKHIADREDEVELVQDAILVHE
jgi:hypothetical protein